MALTEQFTRKRSRKAPVLEGDLAGAVGQRPEVQDGGECDQVKKKVEIYVRHVLGSFSGGARGHGGHYYVTAFLSLYLEDNFS